MEENPISRDLTILLIGGSAGSLEVLLKVLPKLKNPLSFAIVVVVHRKSAEDLTLEELFAMKTSLVVTEVEDKTALLPGCLYIAPSDYHLLFEKNGHISLDISEKVNYSRPSIDVTFESAADAYGERAAAILLSGANADGTNGLIAIQKSGGITVVQEPTSAEMPYMPQHALENASPVMVLDPEKMFEFIHSLNRFQY